MYWSVWFQWSLKELQLPPLSVTCSSAPFQSSGPLQFRFAVEPWAAATDLPKVPHLDHRSWGITSRQHMALAVSLGYPWISKSINVMLMLCHVMLYQCHINVMSPRLIPQMMATVQGSTAWHHPDLLHGRNSARRSNASRPSSAFGPRSLGSDGMRQ